MEVTRWRELTSAVERPVTVAEAKMATRVVSASGSVATQANIQIGSNNSCVTIIVRVAGTLGNDYTAKFLESGNSTPLSIDFDGKNLVVNLETNSGGSAISTATQVIAAIEADDRCAAVFELTSGSGDGSGVAVAFAKTNFSAGVDADDEEAYLTFLIKAATEVVEAYTSQSLITKTFRAVWEEWPEEEDEIELPIGPVISVESVKYYDTNGVLTTFSGMTLDAEDQTLPATLHLNYGETFPSLELERQNAVQVEFTAGYGNSASDVPARIKQCVLFLVAHWYANREPVINGTAVLSNKVPLTFETVLNSFKLFWI